MMIDWKDAMNLIHYDAAVDQEAEQIEKGSKSYHSYEMNLILYSMLL